MIAPAPSIMTGTSPVATLPDRPSSCPFTPRPLDLPARKRSGRSGDPETVGGTTPPGRAGWLPALALAVTVAVLVLGPLLAWPLVAALMAW